MDIALLIPILRQILQAIGGALIARGYLDEGSAEALVGIVINAIVFIWWLIERYQINKRNKAVKELAKDAVGPAVVREVVENA